MPRKMSLAKIVEVLIMRRERRNVSARRSKSGAWYTSCLDRRQSGHTSRCSDDNTVM